MFRLFLAILVSLAVLLSVENVDPAFAQPLNSAYSGSRYEMQVKTMDFAAKRMGKSSVSSRGFPLGGEDSISLGSTPSVNKGVRKSRYATHARQAARKNGVPEDLFMRLVQQESGWNAGARSHKGAIGLAQLMPGTAAVLGVNPRDPQQNLDGGARYLRMMYDKFGNWRLALAAYNAGPKAVERYNGVPPYKETRNYVRIIHGM